MYSDMYEMDSKEVRKGENLGHRVMVVSSGR